MATGPAHSSLASLKSKMRNRVLRRRSKVDLDRRTRLAAMLAHVGPRLAQAYGPMGSACVASLYTPIANEPDPTRLAAALRESGVTLVLPVDWSHGAPLVYREWRVGDRLARGPLGIDEPLATAPEQDPDVLFIPVVAFDRRGHRLGYGAGNVDRTLAALRRRKPIFAIGIGYASQEVAMVPADAHDEKLDLILTERGLLPIADADGTVAAAVRRDPEAQDGISF